MHEVGARGRPPRRAREPAEHERQGQREVRAPAQVPRHPRPVRDAVVAEARRRDDFGYDAALPEVLDLVEDEEAGDVPWRTRVRRRQDRDSQVSSLRSKTRGVASARRASA